MTPACKEWAVVVHALLEGEQILDVRKGGLREDGRHFSVQSTRFWLYPTAEHQKPELLREPYRHWIDLAHAAPVGEPITIEGWADIVKVATVTESEELEAIASKLDLDRRLRGLPVQLEEARSALGPGPAGPSPARTAHRGVGRHLWRLHVVGRAVGSARRPGVVAECARALRRRLRRPARRLRRRPPVARRPLVARSRPGRRLADRQGSASWTH